MHPTSTLADREAGLMLNPSCSKLQPQTLPSSNSALSETWPEEESLTRRGVPGPLTNFHACRLSSTSFVWQWRHQPPPPAEWPCSVLAPAPSGAGRLLHGSWSSPAGNLLRGDTSSGWGSRAGPHSATCGSAGGEGTVNPSLREAILQYSTRPTPNLLRP